MKRLIMAVALFGFIGSVAAQTHQVRGYVKKDGTYVAPHTASNPNAYRYDNKNSQTNGGTQRDEYSSQPATNKENPAYGSYDNDGDGTSNSIDSTPEDADNN